MMAELPTALGNLIMIMTGILLIPALAAFVILLVQCIKHKWTRRLLAPFIVISIVISIMIVCEASWLFSFQF